MDGLIFMLQLGSQLGVMVVRLRGCVGCLWLLGCSVLFRLSCTELLVLIQLHLKGTKEELCHSA